MKPGLRKKFDFKAVKNEVFFRLIGSLSLANSLVARSIGIVLGWPKRRHEPAAIDLAGVQNVLVVRLDEIGDLTMTTGFLRELREALPQASITLVVKRGLGNLVEACPYLASVIEFPCDIAQGYRPFVLPWRALRLGRQLRRRRY